MDDLLKSIILGAPNFGVALVVIIWASRLIERMVDAQEKLVTTLIATCAAQAELQSRLTILEAKFPKPSPAPLPNPPTS